jgi:hypothetical protein
MGDRKEEEEGKNGVSKFRKVQTPKRNFQITSRKGSDDTT